MVGKYRQYTKDGATPSDAIQKAYADFVSQAEETQQSTRPERLGQSQTTQMGKLILAYANTPMQYNRKMSRAIKDILAKGTSKERKAQARRELVYYGAAQSAIFTTLQSLILPGIGTDDDDDTVKWVNNLANTLLRGIGVWGAVVAALKDALISASQEKDIFEPLVNLSPAIGTKIRHLRTALGTKKIYAQSDLVDDANVYRIASGLNAAVNLPADRALKVAEQISDAFSSDFEWYQAALRALGWSRYDLGEPAGNSPLNKLMKGEAGQAHKDGTIEVDPNLSPEEKAKTIAHEEKHVEDMEDGILDYTDSTLTYKGTTYKRKNGKILYNGKWLKEGSKEFPWEKVAYAAEKDSPLNQNGPDKFQKAVEEARGRTKEWYNDPETRKRLKEQTGLSDEEIDKRIQGSVGTEVVPALISATAEYDRGYTRGFREDGTFGDIDPSDPAYQAPKIKIGGDVTEPGLLEHEMAHALGFDDELGLKIQEIAGVPENQYLAKPGETYGNIQEFRNIIGLKPWERNLTPEKLNELIDFMEVRDDADVQQILKNFDIEKLTEALNTVAMEEMYKSNRDSALARLKDCYGK